MAKKKAEEVIEVPEHKYEDIHDKSMKEIVEEVVDEVENKEIIEEKTKIEEKAEEVVVEEEKETPEEMEKRIADKVSGELFEKLSKSLKGEEPTKEEESDYKKFVRETREKEGRTPTYEEALDYVAHKVEEGIEKKQAEKIKAEEEAKAAKEKDEEQRAKVLNDYIDKELEELIESKKIPAVVDKDNENDPGVKARKALFQSMLDINTQRAKEGKDPIYSMKIVYYEHYKDPNAQPAGFDAPIAGASTATKNNDGQFSYQEIHKKSFWDLMTGK